MPPFLKIFTASSSEELASTSSTQLILRTLFHAASSMTRLNKLYYDSHTFRHANPVIIHYLLSASIVHVMNSTATNPILKRKSTRLLRQSLALFEELAHKWPVRSRKSIGMIHILARRWGVSGVSPIKCDPPITSKDSYLESGQPSAERGSDISGSSAQVTNTMHDPSIHEDFDIIEHEHPDLLLFNDFQLDGSLNNIEPIDLFSAFRELNSNEDFTWLFNG